MVFEDLGLQALASRTGDPEPGNEAHAHVGLNDIEKGFVVVLGTISAIVLIPIAIAGVVIWRANKEPDELTTEDDVRRFKNAATKGGSAGLVVESLATARDRKTMRTPFGKVPNLARPFIPKDIGAARALYEG